MQELTREQLIMQRRAATSDFEAQLLGKRDSPDSLDQLNPN